MIDENVIVADLSLDEIVNIVDQRFALTNGDEFLSDEQILREYNRYEALAQERGIIG